MTSTLTGMYSSTVVLGQGSIGDTISVTGTIAIGFYGDNGIYAAASISDSKIYNNGGVIEGGTDGGRLHGGAGIYLAGYGSVSNGDNGHILGGQGGNYYGGNAASGGIGVDLQSGGFLQNTSLIQGGNGGSGASGGYGGIGVYVGGAGQTVNQADIFGGAGGNGGSGGVGGDGGVGIELYVSRLYNSGIILGGTDGYGGGNQAGTGAVLGNNASLSNGGTISGGYENALYPGQMGGAGAAGLYADHTDKISNYGLIEGGAGASSEGGTGTAGGIGVFLKNVYSLSNIKTILGGAGGVGEDKGGLGGAGGVGLFIDHAYGGVTNNGTITGGAGGAGYAQGGVGGFGVSIEGGATMVNIGVITGGAGGAFDSQNGARGEGGAGVYLNGGTLITSGTISSGASSAGIYAPAIAFGKTASTLVIEPGAEFSGAVLANAADTLDLSGSTPGTIDYLGFQFQGFKTINIEAGSNWTVTDVDNFLSSNEGLNIDGSLTVNGNLSVGGSVMVAAGGEWQASGSANIFAEKIALAGGIITCGAQAEFIIGTTSTGAVTGAITLDAGSTVSGFGTILPALDGSGTLDVTKNTLFIDGVLGAGIKATVASGSTLDLRASGTLGASIGGAGTLCLDGTNYGLGATLAIASVTIDSKTTLSGKGTIMGKLANAGTITAIGGKMIIDGVATGQANFGAATSATLDLAGGVTTGGALSGAGTIDIAGASTLDAGIKLTAAHVQDTADITLGSATSVTIAAAEMFSIDAASGSTITLSGAAGDKLSNSGSLVAGGPGTADIAVAFVNAKTVSVSSGTLAFLSGVTNNGTLATGAGTLSFEKKISGTGTLGIGTGTLSLLGGAFATQSVQFEQSSGLLDITNPTSFSAPIIDFAANDKIDLLKTASTTFTFAGGTLTLDDGAKQVAALHFAGTYTQNDFATATDNHNGTLITFK
jgi:hypothetical protein